MMDGKGSQLSFPPGGWGRVKGGVNNVCDAHLQVQGGGEGEDENHHDGYREGGRTAAMAMHVPGSWRGCTPGRAHHV